MRSPIRTVQQNQVWLSLNDPQYTRGAWQVFQTLPGSDTGSFGYELLEGDGEFTLYVQARDEAGNTISHSENQQLSVVLELDTVPPGLPTTDVAEYFVNMPSVDVTFTNATDDISRVQWSWDQTWEDMPPLV